MGMRRLRGRLDQLQGEANVTMEKIQILADEFLDGFTIEVELKMTESLREFISNAVRASVVGGDVAFPLTLPIACHLKVVPEED